MKNAKAYWDNIYQNTKHNQLSWHQNQVSISLDWILEYTNKNDAILDVGAGVSTLADSLLNKGYSNIALLELSSVAIQSTKNRLKNKPQIRYHTQNILDFHSEERFDFWHDRAVFHFLTNKDEQNTYIDKANNYIKQNGYLLLATFSPEGPKQCSNLDIEQYDTAKINKLFKTFKLIKTASEEHPSPNGKNQKFNYFLLVKRD